MTKKTLGSEDEEIEKQELEILKAVAQAWYSHSSSCRPMSEFDAQRRNFKGKPSRFKLQSLSGKASTWEDEDKHTSSAIWDFSHSLWDSYELVTVTRRLESGLDSDDPFANLTQLPVATRRKQESKNSLRNLFNKVSSRRFNQTAVPKEND
ncbi:hypothetical protein L6164_014776 [Bauhinia variegata]|uniref:Uncharacterized protein n=1 Tax=Bauhinia variegata TaxID=167791 RepID=A0ACB9NI90_BAUVA|nr:hypothetical protein L6164_014776 [Bauhinia variegata]